MHEEKSIISPWASPPHEWRWFLGLWLPHNHLQLVYVWHFNEHFTIQCQKSSKEGSEKLTPWLKVRHSSAAPAGSWSKSTRIGCWNRDCSKMWHQEDLKWHTQCTTQIYLFSSLSSVYCRVPFKELASHNLCRRVSGTSYNPCYRWSPDFIESYYLCLPLPMLDFSCPWPPSQLI